MFLDSRTKTTYKMNKENKDKVPSNYYQCKEKIILIIAIKLQFKKFI